MLLSYKDFGQGTSDIDLYFKGALVRVIPEKGKPEWFSYGGATDKGLRFVRDAKHSLYVDGNEIKKLRFDVRFPVGFFNTDDTVAFIERRGARQNLKGLHQTSSISVALMEEITRDCIPFGPTPIESMGVLLLSKLKLTPEFCNKIFEEPVYYELDVAKKQIRNGKAFSRALSPELALVPHHRTNDYLIFRNWLPIGELLTKGRVRILVPEFHDELVEFFAPRGLQFLPAKADTSPK